MASLLSEQIKLNKDAELILAKARKMSLGWEVPGPALCEELIFLAFVALKHPLYISLSRRFSLSTTILTNTLYTSLLRSKNDEPTEENKACERALLSTAV